MPQHSDNSPAPAMASSVAASARPWLTIVGIGEDGLNGLGEAARAAIARAAHVFGGARHLALAQQLINGQSHAWPTPFDTAMTQVLAHRGTPVCVLASGDPFWHGVGTTLARVIDAHDMRVYPAPSSFSLAAARMAWPLQDVTCLSLHGLSVDIIHAHLHPGQRLLVLTSGAGGPAQITNALQQKGFGSSRVTLLEALGGSTERRREHCADQFAANIDTSDINPLNLLAIELRAAAPDIDTPTIDNPQTGKSAAMTDSAAPSPASANANPCRPIPLGCGLADDLFAHDGQITKSSVRALTLSALQPQPGQCLWDIGAGAGSIAIEWLRTHRAMQAIAFEANAARAARIDLNARRFGVPHLQIEHGRAPQALGGLPAPDAIFIGGGGTRPGVMEAAIAALASGGRLVTNGVTLEMQTLLTTSHGRYGGRLIRIAIEEAAPLGTMTTWRPALPVMQWSWSKP